ncbi:hypothetical protein Agub_g7639 [Astrephomene gubernaculifera]|uniref:5-formyltetrahydrofolate cyclo-ligase n=1 Tax=Astrephomene gubernaculifera TaxID=47775 RepID=A0AAD3DUK2_9CHLO|nr:hypothetical protein Agub_g7639 [Astrephomene gubernaculifera]
MWAAFHAVIIRRLGAGDALSTSMRTVVNFSSGLAYIPPRFRGVACNANNFAMAAAVDLREQKQLARKQVKLALRELTPSQMMDESARIGSRILELKPYLQAKTLGIYLHCAKLREVDTTAILEDALQQGKRIYVPVVEDKQSNMKLLHLDDMGCLQCVPPFGILEPAASYTDGTPREDLMNSDMHLEVLLMPGLGFDQAGRRLGRGGGYYDKMVSGLRRRALEAGREAPLLVALSYEAQMLPAVPVSEYDQQIDVLVSGAGGVVGCSQRGCKAIATANTA